MLYIFVEPKKNGTRKAKLVQARGPRIRAVHDSRTKILPGHEGQNLKSG
jgi:hypothetical protein